MALCLCVVKLKFLGQIFTMLQQFQSMSVLVASVKSLPSSHENSCLGVLDQSWVAFTGSNAPRVRCTRTRVDIDQFSSSSRLMNLSVTSQCNLH